MHAWGVASLVCSAALLMGCPIPIKTVRIESQESPVRGVRYTLLRPVYQIGIRIPDQPPGFRPLSDFPQIHIPKQKPTGEPVPLFGLVQAYDQAGSHPIAATHEICRRGDPALSDRCKVAYVGVCAFGDIVAECRGT